MVAKNIAIYRNGLHRYGFRVLSKVLIENEGGH